MCYAGVGTKAEQHGRSCGTLSRRLSVATQAGNDSSIYGGAIVQLQVVVDTAEPDTDMRYKQVIMLPNIVSEVKAQQVSPDQELPDRINIALAHIV